MICGYNIEPLTVDITNKSAILSGRYTLVLI